MRFKNMTFHKQIDEAIKDAERLLSPDSLMMKELLGKNDFAFELGSGMKIAATLMLGTSHYVNIFTYRPIIPWSKAIGYFDGKNIHINARKLPKMSHADLVANLLHEYAHAVGFGHGNNRKTEFKVNRSVPYWLSENVTKWI
jgi:hypothetical protein